MLKQLLWTLKSTDKPAPDRHNEVCPITLEEVGHLQEPYRASDGYTYERGQLTEWLRRHSADPTSPATRLPMRQDLAPLGLEKTPLGQLAERLGAPQGLVVGLAATSGATALSAAVGIYQLHLENGGEKSTWPLRATLLGAFAVVGAAALRALLVDLPNRDWQEDFDGFLAEAVVLNVNNGENFVRPDTPEANPITRVVTR